MSVTIGKLFCVNLSYKKALDGLQSVCCLFSGAHEPINSALTYIVCPVSNSKIQSNDGDLFGWPTVQAMAQSSGAHMAKGHGWLTLGLPKSTHPIAA